MKPLLTVGPHDAYCILEVGPHETTAHFRWDHMTLLHT